MTIRRGDLVEFSTRHYRSWPPADLTAQLWGVALENERSAEGGVLVATADGRHVIARHVYAYGWAGWVPDGLEVIYERVNRTKEEG